KGKTPLHYAVSADIRAVVLICSCSANGFQIPDADNRTPMDLALASPDKAAVKFFASVNQRNRLLSTQRNKQSLEIGFNVNKQ
ncbi:unnamed protein product, partial [Dicrocoelium dendriticum]